MAIAHGREYRLEDVACVDIVDRDVVLRDYEVGIVALIHFDVIGAMSQTGDGARGVCLVVGIGPENCQFGVVDIDGSHTIVAHAARFGSNLIAFARHMRRDFSDYAGVPGVFNLFDTIDHGAVGVAIDTYSARCARTQNAGHFFFRLQGNEQRSGPVGQALVGE